jgi:cytochrome c biogenesis protein CcdA
MSRRRFGQLVVVIVLLCGVTIGGAAASAPFSADNPGESMHDAPTNGTVEIVFFHLPGCPHCDNVEAYLDEQRSEYEFVVKKYNARAQSERFARYLQQYDVPKRQWAVPAVFVGDEYAIGDRPAIELLDKELEAANALRTTPTSGGLSDVTLLTLAGLAATDAVNPCALAVLVVLLTTILTRHPERQRAVLKAGFAFALAVGLTYAAMGILLVFGFKSIATVGVGIEGLRQAFGVLAIGLGVLNLKDAISHGAGGFTMEVPDRWRPSMQRYLTEPLWSRERIVVGAVLAGIAVSLFLLPCTAGPYVVAGGLLADVPWQTAIGLLAVYNLVFIFPMVAITAVVGAGYASAEAVGDWRESHLEALHLVAGIVLIVFGVLLATGIV